MFNSYLFLLLIAGPTVSEARTFRYLQADEVQLEASQVEDRRDAYLPEYSTGLQDNEKWRYGSAVNFKLCLLCYGKYRLFWDNNVHMHATTRQVRHVGWFWEAGVNIVPDKIDILQRHHSQHCLECERPGRFPLENEYVVRFNLYKRKP